MRRVTFFLTGVLIIVLSGCSKYEIPKPELPEDIPTDVSYSADIQPIFDAKCVNCHSGANDPDLTADWSYDELIDGDYVDTDDPLSSVLYEIFSGTHDGRATEEEVLYILGWIVEGAENN
ncbi:MAG: hypothetical protein KAR19_01310 [Bacteroidales bacterium]|nr:hypothetical protein [Bacteroidales bacterium]